MLTFKDFCKKNVDIDEDMFPMVADFLKISFSELG